MIVELSICHDEKNRINKTLSNIVSYEGTLRAETSIINPVLVIEASNLSSYNYLYIPEFNRYYYIVDIVCVRTNLWRIIAHVDVLMSFRDSILEIHVILTDSETTEAQDYLPSDVWHTLVKTKTDIINFPSGLNTTGEYILITSGG